VGEAAGYFCACLPWRDYLASLSQKAGPGAGTGSSQPAAVFRLAWLWRG